MNRTAKYVLAALGVLLIGGVIFVVLGGPLLMAWGAPMMADNAAEAQNQVRQQTQAMMSCGSITIDIVEADGSTAVIQQTTGQKAVGEVSVTWFYTDDRVAQDRVTISNARGAVEASSGQSGSISEVTAQPVNCEGAESASYTP